MSLEEFGYDFADCKRQQPPSEPSSSLEAAAQKLVARVASYVKDTDYMLDDLEAKLIAAESDVCKKDATIDKLYTALEEEQAKNKTHLHEEGVGEQKAKIEVLEDLIQVIEVRESGAFETAAGFREHSDQRLYWNGKRFAFQDIVRELQKRVTNLQSVVK
jgi:hypothetical protein